MEWKPIELVRAHIVNKGTLTICFSDGTTAVFPVEDLLAYAPKRFLSENECPELQNQ